MIMNSFGLEKDRIRCMTPEMSNRIATVSSARLNLEHSSHAETIGTCFALLFSSSLIAYGGPQVNLVPTGKYTPHRAYQHTQAALLQNANIVVIGISHCPSGGMSFGHFVHCTVDVATVPIAPFIELIEISFGY